MEKKALIPLYSQAPVMWLGPEFVILRSPSWGCYPMGEVITTQKSKQSPHRTHGPQLRIIIVPSRASEMSSPSLHLLGMKDQSDDSKSQENVPATALTNSSKAEKCS